MEENNFISVIVPCRNEEKFIAKCLDSIISNDYPKEKLEILIVDGMSEDKTTEILKSYVENFSFIKILKNEKKITPAALNLGIENSRGDIIIKMDAHTIYNNDYISKCVKHLNESGADNVGGVLITISPNNDPISRAIAFSLSHFFGAGNSYFRTGSKEPREVDTVAFGCYKKEIFNKVGFFNEKMVKIEDFEMNYRIRRSGGKIMLFPDIKAVYYPSSDNLMDFFSHNFIDGLWTTYPLKFGFHSVSWRHLVPLAFVSILALSVILSFLSDIFSILLILVLCPYLLVNLLFSFWISIREKDLKLIFFLPATFFVRHVGYGLGSLWGMIKLLFK